MDTKKFRTADVLSTITDRLMGDIRGVYEVLNYMTGESVYTHQLARIIREATPSVLKLHPELAKAIEESEQVTTENWRQWLSVWVERYGGLISVPKMTADEHERIDPISELAEKSPPDKIIVIGVG